MATARPATALIDGRAFDRAMITRGARFAFAYEVIDTLGVSQCSLLHNNHFRSLLMFVADVSHNRVPDAVCHSDDPESFRAGLLGFQAMGMDSFRIVSVHPAESWDM